MPTLPQTLTKAPDAQLRPDSGPLATHPRQPCPRIAAPRQCWRAAQPRRARTCSSRRNCSGRRPTYQHRSDQRSICTQAMETSGMTAFKSPAQTPPFLLVQEGNDLPQRSCLARESSAAGTRQKLVRSTAWDKATAALSAGFELERRPRRREPGSAGASLPGAAAAKAHVRHSPHLYYSKELATVGQVPSTV